MEVEEAAEGEPFDVVEGEGGGEAREVVEREVSVVFFCFSEKLHIFHSEAVSFSI